jgi:hypothetical protein
MIPNCCVPAMHHAVIRPPFRRNTKCLISKHNNTKPNLNHSTQKSYLNFLKHFLLFFKHNMF